MKILAVIADFLSGLRAAPQPDDQQRGHYGRRPAALPGQAGDVSVREVRVRLRLLLSNGGAGTRR